MPRPPVVLVTFLVPIRTESRRGVDRFDGMELVRFTIARGSGDDRVRGIQDDRAGNNFVCSDGGPSRFDVSSFRRLDAPGEAESVWALRPDDLWFRDGAPFVPFES